MHHQNRAAGERAKAERSSKASLNPYYVDDVALTYTDIMRARDADRRPAPVE